MDACLRGGDCWSYRFVRRRSRCLANKPAAQAPIFIGGETDHTLRRIVRYGDGWLPRVRDPAMVLAGIAKLRGLARAAGRAEDSIAISAFGLPAQEGAIAPFRDAGVGRAIIALAPRSADDTMRRLDRYAALVRG